MKDGERVVVTGAAGGGKTLSTRAAMQTSRRLSVWDPKGKWAELDHCEALYTRAAFLARVRTLGPRPARLALIMQEPADFDWWAAATFAWGCYGHENGAMTDAVAEETGNVTHAGKASRGWQRLISQSREFAINVSALMQRPAESDKTIMGNASRVRCFAMPRDLDRRYMCRELDCPPDLLANLKPLEYLERNMQTGLLQKFRAKAGRPFPKWGPVPL